jgi:cholesterol oxidase
MGADPIEIEALVIGSGFGGAIAACRLGQRGIPTIVLERGRRWSLDEAEDTFCTYRNPDGRAAWLSDQTVMFESKPIDRYVGLLERHVEDGITVWSAAGVGGGSLVYNTVLYQPAQAIFERVFPAEISYAEMDANWYPLVADIMQPAEIPGDVLQSEQYRSTRIMIEQASFAGLSVRKATIASDWDVIREEIAGVRKPAAIAGEIWYGINSGTKNSLDRNYLAMAETTGAVDVRPLHEVTRISEAEDGGFRVDCHRIDERGAILEELVFLTRRLFFGAGSMGTSKLLVRAKATGALPKLNEEIGRHWGNNGDTFATRNAGTLTNPGQGGPASIIVEDHDNPILPQSLIVYPEWDAPEGTLTTLGMSLPGELGAFGYDAGAECVTLTFSMESPENRKMIDAANLTYSKLDKGNPYPLPPAGSLSFKGHFHCPVNGFPEKSTENLAGNGSVANGGVTAHPLGGAVMGRACDLFGRVKGYSGLYVVDGAFIPGSTAAANPAFTIAAFAERSMSDILAKDFAGRDAHGRKAEATPAE